jgi:hypothetical protein
MKQKRSVATAYTWIMFPLLLACIAAIVLRAVFIPIAGAAVNEGKNLYLNYVKKRDAAAFPIRLQQVKAGNARIDSVLQTLQQRHEYRDRSFIDALYSYADTCGFAAGKVEAGIPQPVGNHRETAISIEGTGSYRATGSFMEQIENSPHSTRVRQLIIREPDGRGEPEVFIEVVLFEE